MAALTPRQRQVGALVAAGLPNKEIAARLGIRAVSAKNHVYDIGARVGVRGRAAIAAWWVAQQQAAALDAEYARGYRHGYVDGLAAGRRGDRRTEPALTIAR